MKKLLCFLTAATLLLSAVPASLAEETAADAKAGLVSQITVAATSYLATRDADIYMYKEMNWSSIADTLPAKFDLRDRGVVPEIRSQGNWGTCWGFASIAAVETSLLSSMGITVEQYAELTGSPFDLSEKHLAWFGTSHLPTLDQYAEGEYPYTESQASEGEWHNNEDTDPGNAHYFSGGYMGFSAGVFANGMGPVMEEAYPYTANDGSNSTEADWSIDESARFQTAAELKSSNILPSPSQRDADGNYVYNAAGTEAIKQELLAGRGVSIAYHADRSMSPEARMNINLNYYAGLGLDREAGRLFLSARFGLLDPYEYNQEERVLFMKAAIFFKLVDGYSTDTTQEELEALTEARFEEYAAPKPKAAEQQPAQEEPAQEEPAEANPEAEMAAAKLGRDYDTYMAGAAKRNAANQVQYINTDTYAQYNDNQYASPTHAVTIVGWDDDYAVENFPADHQPSAPGAWIVRNSWGEDYGNDGYFFLSYYDQTLVGPETFEYVFDRNAIQGGVQIDSYDLMQASAVSSVQVEAPVYSANVFPVEEESVLAYVSVMTADLNAKATVAVYLLNENYTSPVDGVLLETATADFEFGGYHRIALNNTYQLPAGSVISVVQKQATMTTEGLRYTLPFTNNYSKEAAYSIELLNPSDMPSINWFVGCIGKGESFVNVENTWYDWKDIVDEVQENNSVAALLEFDNMNIKAYFYTVEGVNAAHKYGPAQQTLGAEALICEECGETLIVVK